MSEEDVMSEMASKTRAPRNRTITLSAEEMRRYQQKLLRLSGKAMLPAIENRIVQQDLFEILDWLELMKIPYGETCSYGELAKRLGKPGAARAVGRANGANYLPIVIPCHRVIGSGGKLTGYGLGLDLKAELLAMERSGLGWGKQGSGRA